MKPRPPAAAVIHDQTAATLARWAPLRYVPEQARLWSALQTVRFNVCTAGRRCVSGDTILDGQVLTIAKLAEIGKPIVVATAFGPTMAGAPFRAGFGPMLRIETASGHVQMVTPEHRFWTAGGWRLAAELAVGDMIGRMDRRRGRAAFCCPQQSGVSRRRSISGICQTTTQPGVRRCRKTIQDLPGNYCTYRHRRALLN